MQTTSPRMLLGFEVGTGEPVYIEPDHFLITGQTRMAGKTVTLNAMVSRSQRKAIAFRTKRGEMVFSATNVLKPFYREPKLQRSKFISWQYVKSILEASQGRGMNFEEAWIIRACDGATSLSGVYENIKALQKATRKGGINENQYLKLTAYFDIILPQLKEREFSTKLKLKKGINLMDLQPLTFEMRCLVMERTITYVMEKMKDVVIMLPEGWKYVPQKLTTPVKAAAINLAREGASILNHIWVDSQDIRGVDKVLVGQCTTWMLGVQVEANEAKRTRVSLGDRVAVKEIQGLKLGHFYLRKKDNDLVHVYVLPAGVPEEMGVQVARGEISVQVVVDYLLKLQEGESKEEEEMYRRQNEELRKEIIKLKKKQQPEEASTEEVVKLQKTVEGLETRTRGLQDEVDTLSVKAEGIVAKNTQLEEIISQEEETIKNLHEQLKGFKGFRELLRSIVGPVGGESGPTVIRTEGPSELEITALVDTRLKQLLYEYPEGRFVSIDLSARFKEIIKEDFIETLAAQIQSLTEVPKKAARIVHEKQKIRTSELYYLVMGKATTGRIPVNFYNQLKKGVEAHLISRTQGSGVVRWALDGFVDEKLGDLYDEETREEVKSYLSSLLLP